MRWALAVFWGAVAARPFLVGARRAVVVDRLAGMREPGGPALDPVGGARGAGRSDALRAGAERFVAGVADSVFVRVASAPARARRARADTDALAVELTTAVDLIAVAASAGCTPYLAADLGARWCPPRVASGLGEIVRACAVGATFDDAAASAGRRHPALRGLTEVLRMSDRLGTPTVPALVRLGVEQRAELRRRAEARARTVPVRLCVPLVGCILPAFALLTVVPVVIDGLRP